MNEQSKVVEQTKDIGISASIMCIDWLNAGAELAVLETSGIQSLHWDVIDGSFARDFTMGSSIINRFRKVTKLPSDYHLMVEEPSRLFDAFEISPHDTLTIHQECCRNLHRDLVSIRRRFGCKVGVAICPGTPLEALEYVIEDVDVVLLMTVNPGFMGQKLVPQTLRKIEKLSEMISNLNLDVKIEVDGNVGPAYVPDMVAAGADILVGGTAGLFRRDIGLVSALNALRLDIAKGLSCRKA